MLEAKNDEWILDACAAPGGKTTHILELAPQAKVIALDVEAHRLKRVEENLARLHQRAMVICGDASRPDEWLAQIDQRTLLFDRILLDAPCSATGVIRRHPDIKWLRYRAVGGITEQNSSRAVGETQTKRYFAVRYLFRVAGRKPRANSNLFEPTGGCRITAFAVYR